MTDGADGPQADIWTETAGNPPVFRFAPSPNGRLHLGHGLSALLNQRAANASGGRLLLRIEDIDTTRCTPAFEAAIYEDLAWLGLRLEEPVRRQSRHFADYRDALDTLIDAGLAYPSFRTRGEVRREASEAEEDGRPWLRDPDGAPLYPTDERETDTATRQAFIEAGRPHVWRLDMDRALAHAGLPLEWEETGAGPDGETGVVTADPASWGDIVLARRDVPVSYNLAVVLDDALQGVTHVVRGRDLFHATSIHRLLQVLLGLPTPAYHHHRLLLGEDGRKLSKSRGDTALSALREAGTTPADIARMVGLSPDATA
ncbi:tRNA glutamyl-Q(34) synthetase GluQRS [Pararhizobium mangrovi]|uniref:tRNA glutamyl-Q(34) synthetase GluQRS n=1 Tax=Pararhizobium mangrovi TaxID=2590452 RepID=A0A506TXA9_9HYPH|nr:tRNA glutamyl-Q(34) synthetase GluQRS [Pararhizobium mangrovi]TPW25946.1 tRNA glutamyl-Q(34) synthetase GluQRS [Pararhizobium mangrovi]